MVNLKGRKPLGDECGERATRNVNKRKDKSVTWSSKRPLPWSRRCSLASSSTFPCWLASTCRKAGRGVFLTNWFACLSPPSKRAVVGSLPKLSPIAAKEGKSSAFTCVFLRTNETAERRARQTYLTDAICNGRSWTPVGGPRGSQRRRRRRVSCRRPGRRG